MLSDKKLAKLYKVLGEETINDLDALSETDLKARIVQANSAMKQVEDELDANEEFQALVESKKAMEQGKKDVNKRQNAIVKYSLHRLAKD